MLNGDNVMFAHVSYSPPAALPTLRSAVLPRAFFSSATSRPEAISQARVHATPSP